MRRSYSIFSAEEEGFEPPEPLGSTVFKTAAIDHSAIPPIRMQKYVGFFIWPKKRPIFILFFQFAENLFFTLFFLLTFAVKVDSVNVLDTMNKAQLIEEVAREANVGKAAAKRAVDALTCAIVRTLREGGKITLTGLGTFSVAVRPARMGRNPRTGAPVKVAARKVVKFRPTLDLEQ